MKLYLARHGEYVLEGFSRAGSLSDKGIEEIEKFAKLISPLKIKVSNIFHSGKIRALQTAEILAKSFISANGVNVYTGINPDDDVVLFAKEIDAVVDEDNVLIVGHLPFMSRLVSTLVVNDQNKEVVTFLPGTIVCLEKINHTKWVINWMLSPDLLGHV
jgi:phosphohistidine phosphatase